MKLVLFLYNFTMRIRDDVMVAIIIIVVEPGLGEVLDSLLQSLMCVFHLCSSCLNVFSKLSLLITSEWV